MSATGRWRYDQSDRFAAARGPEADLRGRLVSVTFWNRLDQMFAPSMRHAVWLSMLLAGAPSFAARVTLSEDWGADRWRGYPETVNVPQSRWSGDQLLVDVVVNWTSGSGKIDKQAVTVKLDGDALKLCYRWKGSGVGATPSEVGVLAPVRLIFAVSDLPRRAYSVSVTENCG